MRPSCASDEAAQATVCSCADDSAARNFMVVSCALARLRDGDGPAARHRVRVPRLHVVASLRVLRLRQEHTNTVMFGFLSTGHARPLVLHPAAADRASPLERATRRTWSWCCGPSACSSASSCISMAHTQSREYAEMVWGVDIAILVALVLSLVIVLMTIARRVEPKLYVRLWFIIGTVDVDAAPVLHRQRRVEPADRRAHRHQRRHLQLVLRAQRARAVVHDGHARRLLLPRCPKRCTRRSTA